MWRAFAITGFIPFNVSRHALELACLIPGGGSDSKFGMRQWPAACRRRAELPLSVIPSTRTRCPRGFTRSVTRRRKTIENSSSATPPQTEIGVCRCREKARVRILMRRGCSSGSGGAIFGYEPRWSKLRDQSHVKKPIASTKGPASSKMASEPANLDVRYSKYSPWLVSAGLVLLAVNWLLLQEP
jgi:hypothetical protein